MIANTDTLIIRSPCGHKGIIIQDPNHSEFSPVCKCEVCQRTWLVDHLRMDGKVDFIELDWQTNQVKPPV